MLAAAGVTPAVAQPVCAAADVNCDGAVNGGDLLSIRAPGVWQSEVEPGAKADVNQDGQVNGGDLLSVRAPGVWQTSTGPCTCEIPTAPDCARNIPPRAVISLPRDLHRDEPVRLSGLGSFDLDDQIVAWSWDLGDGTTQDQSSFFHAFAAEGEYTIRLTVEDACGEISATTTHVRVHAPFGLIRHDFPLEIARYVHFEPTTPAQAGEFYHWQFPNGVNGYARETSFAFPNTGTFVVQLTIFDSADWTVRASEQRTVKIIPGIELAGTATSAVGRNNGLALADGRAWVASATQQNIGVLEQLNSPAPALVAEDIVAGPASDVAAGAGYIALAAGSAGVFVYASPEAGTSFLDEESSQLAPVYHLPTSPYGRVASGVLFHGRTLYVSCDYGLTVVDIGDEDPANWTWEHFDFGRANLRMVAIYDRLLVATYWPYGIRVLGIDDPLDPLDLGFVPLEGSPRGLSVAYLENSALLGIMERLPNGSALHLQEWTQSTTAAPQQIARVVEPYAEFGGIALAPDAAYVSASLGVRSYNLTTPSNPAYTQFRSFGDVTGTLQIGPDDRLYIGCQVSALRVMNR